jgi:hypothetical protein
MPIPINRNLSRLAFATCFVAVAGVGIAEQSMPAVPATQLQPYTAPDQSASAGVPAGWKVTSGSQTVIEMTGPRGETVVLGKTIIAHDGAFQPSQHGPGPAELSMPKSSSLVEKLTMIIQRGAAIGGKAAPQINVTSATPLQLPASLGECGRVVANVSDERGPTKIMTTICSLPSDTNGFYKNILLLAKAPASVAADSAPIAKAIFSSYKIPQVMLQKKLGPVTLPPPPMPSGGGSGTMPRMPTITAPADDGWECYDLVAIRETPKYQLPVRCGGYKPD